MKEAEIKFKIYRHKLIDKSIIVNSQNYYIVLFLLKLELFRNRSRLKRLKEKKVIKSISRYPKIFNKKYTDTVMNLFLSRKTLIKSINILENKNP